MPITVILLGHDMSEYRNSFCYSCYWLSGSCWYHSPKKMWSVPSNLDWALSETWRVPIGFMDSGRILSGSNAKVAGQIASDWLFSSSHLLQIQLARYPKPIQHLMWLTSGKWHLRWWHCWFKRVTGSPAGLVLMITSPLACLRLLTVKNGLRDQSRAKEVSFT